MSGPAPASRLRRGQLGMNLRYQQTSCSRSLPSGSAATASSGTAAQLRRDPHCRTPRRRILGSHDTLYGGSDPLWRGRRALMKAFTGGETKTGTGEITIFDQGMGSQPYSRSASLGVSATAQTIRHEVGHVIANDLPPDKKMEFFEKVVDWIEYPWAWISVPNPPYETGKRKRTR